MADVEFLKELCEPLGHVVFKKMFGGWGIMSGDRMFGLVAHDTLYFKVDEETSRRFEERGLERFTYVTKDGRRKVMSYARAPEEVFDDPDAFLDWARAAIGAAMRTASAAKAPKRRAAKAGRGRVEVA
jgi:DNA transformation protein